MSDIKELIFRSKIIFWDFDGVIKKSNQVKNDAFINLFEDIKKEQKEYILSHHINNQGLSRFKKIPYYMEYLGIETKESNVQAYLNRFSELVFDGVINSDWVEGVLEILSELDKSILITATPQDEIERIIEKRLKEYNPVLPEVTGGYQKLYVDHVMQADKGADLDFLVGRRGSVVKRHSH